MDSRRRQRDPIGDGELGKDQHRMQRDCKYNNKSMRANLRNFSILKPVEIAVPEVAGSQNRDVSEICTRALVGLVDDGSMAKSTPEYKSRQVVVTAMIWPLVSSRQCHISC